MGESLSDNRRPAPRGRVGRAAGGLTQIAPCPAAPQGGYTPVGEGDGANPLAITGGQPLVGVGRNRSRPDAPQGGYTTGYARRNHGAIGLTIARVPTPHKGATLRVVEDEASPSWARRFAPLVFLTTSRRPREGAGSRDTLTLPKARRDRVTRSRRCLHPHRRLNYEDRAAPRHPMVTSPCLLVSLSPRLLVSLSPQAHPFTDPASRPRTK